VSRINQSINQSIISEDPAETNNLADQEEYKDVLEELMQFAREQLETKYLVSTSIPN
jgi:hypothetical protein